VGKLFLANLKNKFIYPDLGSSWHPLMALYNKFDGSGYNINRLNS